MGGDHGVPGSADPTDGRAALRADCAHCIGLCCVIPAFTRSADFPIDKPAGVACPNLAADSGCQVHGTLRERGFVGCTVYDCFGAGQHLTGRVDHVTDRSRLAESYRVLRDLHELRWYLAEAADLVPPGHPLGTQVASMDRRVALLADSDLATLPAVPVDQIRYATNTILTEVSELARGGVEQRPFLRGVDLAGAVLNGADLKGANLRGASMIAADLRRADLTLADLTGADLRGADLRGVDLRRSLFLTQPQLTSARGDRQTQVPAALTAPAHWRPRDLPLGRQA